VFTCSARIGVERAPAVSARPERANPYTVVDQATVQLRVHVRNSGNVPLQVDAQRVTQQLWVRDDDRRRDDKMLAARRVVRSERAEPRTPERLRPRQSFDFDLVLKSPQHLLGVRPRRWWVPIGVRGEDVDPECVFVDFYQRPRWELEQRMVWLAGAVVAALLVLVVFTAILAS
jgi:hypothetical protein